MQAIKQRTKLFVNNGVLKERTNGDLDLYFKYAVSFDSCFPLYSHFLCTIHQ